MVDLAQRRQVVMQAITKEAGNPAHHGSGHVDERQSTLKRPWPDKRCQDEATWGGEADPDPLAPILTQFGALPIRASLLRLLSPDEAPHLIELHLGHWQVPEQVRLDLVGLVRRSLQPHQDGFFGHAKDKGDSSQIDLDQEHLESHHDFLFRSLQVKEDGIARLGKGGVACGALEDAALATLRQIGRDRPDVPAVHQLSIGAIGIGAQLAPGPGCSHGQSSGQ